MDQFGASSAELRSIEDLRGGKKHPRLKWCRAKKFQWIQAEIHSTIMVPNQNFTRNSKMIVAVCTNALIFQKVKISKKNRFFRKIFISTFFDSFIAPVQVYITKIYMREAQSFLFRMRPLRASSNNYCSSSELEKIFRSVVILRLWWRRYISTTHHVSSSFSC